MKKTFSLFILAWALTNVGFGQTSDIAGNKLQSGPGEFNFASKNPSTPLSSGSILLNDINTKALRDFMTSYKNPTDIRWTILTEGFRVHFYVDGIQTRIFYDKKGNRAATIRYYSENKLPAEIRHLVKSNYYDFSISIVTEVSISRKIAYLVKMVDKTSWKTIKVVDGEMEVIEEYSKS